MFCPCKWGPSLMTSHANEIVILFKYDKKNKYTVLFVIKGDEPF